MSFSKMLNDFLPTDLKVSCQYFCSVYVCIKFYSNAEHSYLLMY